MSNLNQSHSEAARLALPGGVSHELRYAEPYPIFINHAKGAEKWDVEGKRYIDFKMGSASQLLGHCHADIVAAVQKQAAQVLFSADSHAAETRWAEWLNQLFPSADMSRFTASGTESTMLALRLGRAYSGKDKVLRIDGHYHGWHDHLLKGAKPGFQQSTSLGIPTSITDLVSICAPTPEAMQAALKDDAIGTVIIEASGANYGAVPLATGTLKQLHATAKAAGCVVIFDEIITGLRWAPGGRQARDKVVPDLTTLAKVVTGGLPGGAVCGRADIMQLMNNGISQAGLAPPVSHKGTFNGSPLVAAAALAAMPLFATGEVQQQADAMAHLLREGINQVFHDLSIEACAYGDSSTCHLFFGADDITGMPAQQIRGQSPALVKAMRRGLLENGVDLMNQTSFVTSAAHTPALVDEAVAIFRQVMQSLRASGEAL